MRQLDRDVIINTSLGCLLARQVLVVRGALERIRWYNVGEGVTDWYKLPGHAVKQGR